MASNRLGHHRFAKQICGWGSFADVQLRVQPAERVGTPVSFDVVDLDNDPRRADWIAGVEFGVRYALEHLPRSERQVAICVLRLHTNPVDSSTMAVAFATCLAVWNALGYVPQVVPMFDEKSRSFVFPS
jgi:hypothetical protein